MHLVLSNETDRKNKLRIVERNNLIVATLYDTDIVEISVPKREVTLVSGGYKTATTKRRMNQMSEDFNLGFRVYSRGKVWYVQTESGQHLIFLDGITFGW
jgi:hypothetical protein